MTPPRSCFSSLFITLVFLPAALLPALVLAPPVRAELPFVTEEAETLEPGMMSIDFGVGYRDQARDWALPLRKSQWDLGETRLSFGLGRFAEFQVSGALARRIDFPGPNDETDNADWTIGTKIWLLHEREHLPSLSLLVAVKLPNGDDALGASTDETDVFGHFLLSKQLAPRHFLHANAGFAVLGNPNANSVQNDVYQLRLAWEYRFSDSALLGLEWLLQHGPKDGDDPSYFRLLLAREIRDAWALYGAVGIGSGADADGYETHIGVRHRFALFNPDVLQERRQAW